VCVLSPNGPFSPKTKQQYNQELWSESLVTNQHAHCQHSPAASNPNYVQLFPLRRAEGGGRNGSDPTEEATQRSRGFRRKAGRLENGASAQR